MDLRAKRLLAVVLCLTLIPIIGLIIGHSVEAKYERDFVAAVEKTFGAGAEIFKSTGMSLSLICQEKDDALREVCSYVDDIHLFQNASLYTLLVGIALIFTVLVVKHLVGNNRSLLAVIFNPIATMSLIIVSASIFAQGALLVYGLYIGEVVFLGIYHPKLIGIIGLAALVAAFLLAKSSIFLQANKPAFVFGETVSKTQAPGLYALIDDLSKRTGARKPDNVLVGLEPNFYVTAAETLPIGQDKPLKGTTLYLSLPFLSILSQQELAAVIGHELGHFKGEDTKYSMQFYPAYSKLYRAMGVMNEQADSSSATAIFALPALITVSFVLQEFGIIEKSIGRKRELEADLVGASVSSPKALVSALLKFAAYGDFWPNVRKHNVDKLAEGNIYNDLSDVYCRAVNTYHAEENISHKFGELLGSSVSHPTDTHPTLGERMRALEVDANSIRTEDVGPSNTHLESYFATYEAIAESLTVMEHRLMVATGQVIIPAGYDND